MGSTETWGISGSTFLVAYLLVAVAVLAAGVSVRRSLRAGRAADGDGLQRRPEDVAYLNGGPELAVYAALSAMHVDGSIATYGGTSAGVVRAAGAVPAGTSTLQRAIHAASVRPVPRRTLPAQPRVAGAFTEIRGRLEQSGLLLTAAQQRAYRRPGFWLLAVAALGLVRMLAVVPDGRPVGYLLLLTVAVAVVALVLLLGSPARTRAGDVALEAARTRHSALSPAMRPDWAVVGAGGAALSVGVFGVGALQASDPAFAEELEAQRSAAAGGGSHVAGGGDAGAGSAGGGSGG